MKIGYARASAHITNIASQIEALKKAGCEKIHEEIATEAKTERPILANLIGTLNAKDILVVTPARSLRTFFKRAHRHYKLPYG